MTIWTVPLTEYTNDADKGIVVCHWRATVTDGDYTASSYGTCGFTPDPESPDFVAFEDLTEEIVLGWVQNALDTDAMEANLASQIEAQKTPATLSGMPWAE